MKTSESQQIHLIAERSAMGAKAVPVGHGLRRVNPAGGRLSDFADGGGADPKSANWFLEQVLIGRKQPCLLLVSPADQASASKAARVNGLRPPRVAVLKEKDFVQFPGGFAAYVSVLRRPHIGPPPPELLGRECPVCRVKFVATAKCYQCSCGVAFHNEDQADFLQCVQTRKECVCGRPIILQEQFTDLPELTDD